MNIKINRILRAFIKKVVKVPKETCYNEFMTKIVEALKNTKTFDELATVLGDATKQKDGLKEIGPALFKHEDFVVETFRVEVGLRHESNLKLLNGLKMKIVPQHIETITKDYSVVVITKMPGTKNSELTQIWKNGYEGYYRLSKKAKLKAYRDLQKLTKAGYVDDGLIRSGTLWFYAPDDNTLMLPVWGSLRKIQPGESQKTIMEEYYRQLFKWDIY